MKRLFKIRVYKPVSNIKLLTDNFTTARSATASELIIFIKNRGKKKRRQEERERS